MSVDDKQTQEQFETIQDVPVDQELIEAVEEAGAANLAVQLLKQDPEDISGVGRNSVREEIRKYCFWADEISSKEIADKHHYGGHFFQAAWDGRLADAKHRADGNNKKLLRALNLI